MSEHDWRNTAPPVEATIHFALDGFDTSLTIRADDGKELMPTLSTTVAYLKDHGATPAQPAQAQPPAPAPQAGAAQAPVCPIHHAPMKRREKNGDAWYSHQATDPETGSTYYCKGKGKE